MNRFGIVATLIFLAIISIAIPKAVAQAQRTIYVTVEGSKSGFLDGLLPENFDVSVNGKKATVLDVSRPDKPIKIGVLFDVSGSVLDWGPKDLNRAATNVFRMVESDLRGNEYFLIGFNKDAATLADWTRNPEDISNAIKKLPDLQVNGRTESTSLYASCILAIKKLDESKSEKKVLIVLSDGVDNSESTKMGEVLRAAEASDAIVYFISITDPVDVNSLPTLVGNEFTRKITGLTGGTIYHAPLTTPESKSRSFVKNAEARLDEAFSKLVSDIYSQYAVRFTAPEERAGEVQTVDVQPILSKDVKKDAGSISLRFRKKYRVS